MKILATVSRTELLQIQRRGLDPKAAVDAILAEARQRYPKERSIVMQPQPGGFGLHIIAL